MKKSILKITIILSAIALLATSCNKDSEDLPAELNGQYKLVMDNSTVAEGTTLEVGMIGNAISLSEGEDFGILISGVPVSVGGEAEIGGAGADCSVTITGKNLLESGSDEMYFSISGTVKRTSASKITFSGNCSSMGGTEVHTFSGSAESDAYKII